jgi:hypothetical protein
MKVQLENQTSSAIVYSILRNAVVCLVVFPWMLTNTSYGQNVAYNLKNGLTIQGIQGEVGEISITLAYGQTDGKPILMMDNGLKRTFVSKRELAQQGESTLSDTEISVYQNVNERKSDKGNGILLEAGNFNEFGHRTIWVRIPLKSGGTRVMPVVQGITKINPMWTEVQTLITADKENRFNNERWDMRLATSSIPAEVLRNLLHNSIDTDNQLERMNIVDFYVEAEQYRRAIEEHNQIIREFPDSRDDFEQDALELQQAYGRSVLREARFRESVGQIKLASDMAAAIDTSKMSQVIQEDFRTFLQESLLEVDQELKQTHAELVARAQAFMASRQEKPDEVEAVQTLINEVTSDLSRGNSNRLASYKRLIGDQTQSAEQLMALAISGWTMGSNKAIDNFAVAQSLFTVRDLVKEYLSPATPGRRVTILQLLEKYEAGEPENLAAIINNITPPQAPDLSQHTGEEPLEFEIAVKGTKAQNFEVQKFKYYVHLPPGYDPYRKYPCLLTLRDGATPLAQLNRWAGSYNPKLGVRTGRGMRHGYIVVSLDWKAPGQRNYQYSAREHKVILGCMRGMLKKFAIDSDRFFITGHRAGAEAAYDIAISHPEHWAGVIGISGRIAKYPIRYFSNQHLGLNVYSVVGTKDHGSISSSLKCWNSWLGSSRFNKCMVIEYMGRLAEPFYEEFPSILEWCDVSRRSWPTDQGCEIECKTLRPWDNYFWFMEFHGMPEANIVRPPNWPANENGPLGIKSTLDIGAKLTSTKDKTMILAVSPRNIGSGMTFWLSPDFIDFKKKLLIKGRGGGFDDFVKASRETILEDVRIRGDRKRPYWAKVRLK